MDGSLAAMDEVGWVVGGAVLTLLMVIALTGWTTAELRQRRDAAPTPAEDGAADDGTTD